jgi:hypothetical protein
MGYKSYSLSSEITKPVVVLTFLGILFFLWFFGPNPEAVEWVFVASPPIPSYARNLHTSYSFYSFASRARTRTITFETNQPLEKIYQFYQAELSKHGWHVVCQPTAPGDERLDQLRLDSGDEVLELYEPLGILPRRQKNLSLHIKAAEGDMRLVEIVEAKYQLYCPDYLLTPTPTPDNSQSNITPTPGAYPGPEVAEPDFLTSYP